MAELRLASSTGLRINELTRASALQHIRRALTEDLSTVGDITSESIISAGDTAQAEIVAKEPCIVAGIEIAELTFTEVDRNLRVEFECEDGEPLRSGGVALRIHGSTRSILIAERTALNFLQRLSGVASLTSEYVKRVGESQTKILDTRKTTPGFRLLEKYAVLAGGGHNHRFGLYDMVLIKENHVLAAGGISKAVASARARVGKSIAVVVEVADLDQLRETLELKPDRVLLDNMRITDIQQAVEIAAGQLPIEVSGGVSLQTVRQIAETGVDFISVGALTHSYHAMDFSLLLTQ